MAERRYTEDEMADIFRRAADPQAADRRLPGAGEGMTLAELQDIGRQVGIAPDAVARAAFTLDPSGPAPVRRILGFPIGVSRTVELNRELDDAAWERLVVDLRRTFDAKGVVSRDGTLRQWTNGNLHVYLEPGEHGQRLRMRTYNASARMVMFVGLVYTGFGAIASAAVLARHGVDLGRLLPAGIFGLAGVAIAGFAAFRLPGWARRRLEQMRGVAERLLSAGAPPPPPPPPAA